MVRNYKPKTDRSKADGGVMKRAVEEVVKGRSVAKTSKELGIDRTTLSRYVKKYQSGKVKEDNEFSPRYNARTVFSKEEEDGLEEYVIKCSELLYGITYDDVRRLAFEYAVKKDSKMPDSWKSNSKAGKDWMLSFMKRHKNLSLRTPEATSISRAQAFNRQRVQEFFDVWKSTQTEKKFGPESIFNLDESGITTVQKSPKVLAKKGSKQVGHITAAERGTLVTIVCCVNAVGRALPPAMIFPRVKYRDYMIRGAPSGTLGLATPSGWMNSELFPRVLEHFISHMGCSTEKPAVLFIDNHESHLGINVIDIARANGLSIITFPPHTSHKLQPLDISVYGPLKSYYKKALHEWNLSNPGKRISIYDIPECFTKAFYKALSMENASSGFKRSGIWPINSEIFSDYEFQAADVFMVGTPTETLDVSNSVHTEDQLGDYEGDLNEPATAVNRSIANTVTSSFSEISAIRPLPKRKAEELLKSRKRRADVGCKLITSTSENINVFEQQQKKHATQKSKVVRKKNSYRQIRQEVCSQVSGETTILLHDSSDDNVEFVNVEEPAIGDFVLIAITQSNPKQQTLNYVGKIINITKEDDELYEVDIYKQSKLRGRFFKPDVKDTRYISRNYIVMRLPKPTTTASTRRVRSMSTFSVDLNQYNCQ